MNAMKKLIGILYDKDKVRKTYNKIRFPELPDALSVINGDGCFNPQTGNYDKQLRLKERLPEIYWRMDDNDYLKVSYWIIRKWGDISSFREANNDRKLIEFREWLGCCETMCDMPKGYFSRISSLSKVASFLHPDRCAIYDSRAVYSFNWLFFKAVETSFFHNRKAETLR